MFYTKITDKKKLRKFKKRSEPGLDFKTPPYNRRTYVYYPSGGNMELIIYKYIIKAFRRKSRRRRYKLNFFIKPNYIITKKSKNARMGKGKGKFRRFSLKLRKNKLFMAINGLSHYRIVRFFKKIKQTVGLNFTVSRNRAYRRRPARRMLTYTIILNFCYMVCTLQDILYVSFFEMNKIIDKDTALTIYTIFNAVLLATITAALLNYLKCTLIVNSFFRNIQK